jgi:hypothetical protein
MKPYFRSKGTYKDRRKRIVIQKEEEGVIRSKALPKPEKLWELLEELDRKKIKKVTKQSKINGQGLRENPLNSSGNTDSR